MKKKRKSLPWKPSASDPVCPYCAGPKPVGLPCYSCSYKPGDPLWPKDLEGKPLEELKVRADILIGLGLQFAIPKKVKEILYL